MKKIFIPILLLFLWGCEAKYTIHFSNDKIKENITVTLDKTKYTTDDFEQLKNTSFFAIQDPLDSKSYQTNFKETKKAYIGIFEYEYTSSEYNRSNILNTCYDVHSLVQDEDEYILTTSNIVKCMPFEYVDIDKITIVLKTDYKVIESNADKKKKNQYIWEITNENKENKPIRIIFDRNQKTTNVSYLIVLACIVIPIGIGALILWLIYKKNDEI